MRESTRSEEPSCTEEPSFVCILRGSVGVHDKVKNTGRRPRPTDHREKSGEIHASGRSNRQREIREIRAGRSDPIRASGRIIIRTMRPRGTPNASVLTNIAIVPPASSPQVTQSLSSKSSPSTSKHPQPAHRITLERSITKSFESGFFPGQSAAPSFQIRVLFCKLSSSQASDRSNTPSGHAHLASLLNRPRVSSSFAHTR